MKKIIIRICTLFSVLFTNSIFFNLFLSLTKNHIKSFFICYSVSDKKYINYFVYPWLFNLFYGKLVFIGFNIQQGKIGINLLLLMNENDFSNQNKQKLFNVHKKLTNFKEKYNINYINYAGIIPSIFNKHQITSYQSASNTDIANIVFLSFLKVIKNHNIKNDENLKIFIIGGNGFIGKEISKKLINYNKIIIDIDSDINIFNSEKVSNSIIINVSKKGVLEDITTKIDLTSFILLNEVFPEPFKLKKYFSHFYHIKGINAKMYPSLPYGYSNALPCCSYIPTNDVITIDNIILLKY